MWNSILKEIVLINKYFQYELVKSVLSLIFGLPTLILKHVEVYRIWKNKLRFPHSSSTYGIFYIYIESLINKN